MDSFLGLLIGKFIGVLLVSMFFDLILSKWKKFPDKTRKVLAVFISALLYILIPTFITERDSILLDKLGKINITSFCAFLIAGKYLELNLKAYLIAVLAGLIIAFLSVILLGIILALMGGADNSTLRDAFNILGAILIFLGFTLILWLVNNKKLPGTK